MNDKEFFKPTPLYKEFMILDLIEKDSKITQRVMSDHLGVSVSMINAYLDQYEESGYIKRKYITTKTVEYQILKKGLERKKVLNIWYLKASNSIYMSAKDNIISFLNFIIQKGFRKILLYGAGEVAELMLKVINDDRRIPLEVVAIIDDNPSKINQVLVNLPVIPFDMIKKYEHDAIMIASYTHHESMYNRLIAQGYKKDRIIRFFDN
jgi:FlaA1/EpsC-like NDP-sugar epimerase